MSPALRAGAIALMLLAMAAPATAQQGKPATFTQVQADQGAEIYRDRCALCHGANLANPEFAPSLNGARFKRRWGGQSAAGLFSYITHAMPPGQTGVMSADDYAAVMAYLIGANGGVAGPQPLPSDTKALSGMVLPAAQPQAAM